MFIRGKLLRYIAVAWIPVILLSYSPVRAQELRLNLVATFDDQPAMKDIAWTVYRTDTDTKVTSAKYHSTHVTLPAGNYRVVATLTENDKTITRTRSFQLRTSDSRIVVPMD
ncbi:hypothetical protein [uncultured Thiothrix sp.]|jgi:hypothetical protein|uniref:hypothetical protein n=1 Tax=uncultured Thiothrix sp. TaxID=223185 RepID=UPI00261410E3|nr:hypothetical protein [uncultured Thiothrix sp.]HMT92650.1 hypothetical protein [Thiolinea sp.]